MNSGATLATLAFTVCVFTTNTLRSVWGGGHQGLCTTHKTTNYANTGSVQPREKTNPETSLWWKGVYWNRKAAPSAPANTGKRGTQPWHPQIKPVRKMVATTDFVPSSNIKEWQYTPVSGRPPGNKTQNLEKETFQLWHRSKGLDLLTSAFYRNILVPKHVMNTFFKSIKLSKQAWVHIISVFLSIFLFFLIFLRFINSLRFAVESQNLFLLGNYTLAPVVAYRILFPAIRA